MAASVNKPLKAFFSYPFTWVVITLIILVHGAFSFWFPPSLIMQAVAFGIDVFSLGLWFVLAFKSKAFRERYSRMPYEDKAKEIVHILKKCPNVFSKPAQRCIDLIQKINQEFPDQSYSYELDLMLANIHNLAENNQTLYERSLAFGTQEQKANMQAIINQQIKAINNTLNTLKSFSGNLTLIAANQEQSVVATDELKYINQGLQEVIEEFDE